MEQFFVMRDCFLFVIYSTTLRNKEEKLSAFLDTGQRNKGEKKTNKRREEKRNLTLIMGSLLTKRDIRKKNFFLMSLF